MDFAQTFWQQVLELLIPNHQPLYTQSLPVYTKQLFGPFSRDFVPLVLAAGSPFESLL